MMKRSLANNDNQSKYYILNINYFSSWSIASWNFYKLLVFWVNWYLKIFKYNGTWGDSYFFFLNLGLNSVAVEILEISFEIVFDQWLGHYHLDWLNDWDCNIAPSHVNHVSIGWARLGSHRPCPQKTSVQDPEKVGSYHVPTEGRVVATLNPGHIHIHLQLEFLVTNWAFLAIHVDFGKKIPW